MEDMPVKKTWKLQRSERLKMSFFIKKEAWKYLIWRKAFGFIESSEISELELKQASLTLSDVLAILVVIGKGWNILKAMSGHQW